MFINFSKTMQEFLNIHSLWEIIKKYWPYIISLINAGGGYMISNLIGGILLFTGTISILIWIRHCMTTEIESLKVELTKRDNIESNVMIVKHDFITLPYPDKKFIHLGVNIVIYNYSNHSVEICLDLEKTISIIKDPSINSTVIITDKNQDLNFSLRIVPPGWSEIMLCSYVVLPKKNETIGSEHQTITLDVDILASLKYCKLLEQIKYYLSHKISGRYMFFFDSTGKILIYTQLPTKLAF